MRDFKLQQKLFCFALCFIFISCSEDVEGIVAGSSSSAADCTANYKKVDYSFAREVNKSLGRGINLGNGFDAGCSDNGVEPEGGWDNCWGNPIKEEYFSLLREAGFQSIRLPVRWNSRAADESPYKINASFMARVKDVVNQAINAGFPVIINIHHYNELISASGEKLTREREKFTELWRQIADAFKGYSNDSLVFELLNEPRASILPTVLNSMAEIVWPVIRTTNPGRIIMINPSSWGHFTNMLTVQVPGNDNLVILSGHYYFPHEFTHQGQSNYPNKGVSWGTETERKKLVSDVEGTAEKLPCRFPDINGGSVPVNIGEFGTTSYAETPQDSRIAYHTALREYMEKYDMSWHYWCLTGCSFDLYNKISGTWNNPVLESLIPKNPQTPEEP